jgi:hypothetical protein
MAEDELLSFSYSGEELALDEGGEVESEPVLLERTVGAQLLDPLALMAAAARGQLAAQGAGPPCWP